ncbi:cell division protein FtsA [Alkalibacillus silvisoli]|uniref:Cell division FtsA domain-containing protein n=1 Tax=Alkalibacillus silvisoli TaxID=392823 RepID=A0ABN0ZS39_9BACI
MNKLFALDIGTRSVVGIILHKEDEVYRVIDMVTREHKERSMVDGQIHNIMAVSDVIKEVKDLLESKHGPLTKVCVAAAGRALKTKKSTIKINISEQPLMTHDDIFHMELTAVQQAQYQLAEKEQETSSTQYYCVGYSVLHYYLDDHEIGSLIDQQGDEATVDIIATFLPKVVVESLISALHRANLEMEALTLEPIAAIQVLIPQSMRKLNVALIDIGAGTSDIAITKEGTVVAYGMVSKAGDEITEAISQQYLLDFHQAEEAKRQLVEESVMEIEDILGFKSELPYDHVTTDLNDATSALAKEICHQIIALNKEAPQAVMLVGGGSLTPKLTEHIAEKLQLPNNRVAVRGIDAIKGLKGQEHLPSSPEFVTPIGIAIAAQKSPVHYISVTVNGRMVRLFDVKQLTIGDCLLAAGLDVKKLYGKPGIGQVITFNTKQITLPGSFGQPPKIEINGQLASIQDYISHGDEINVIKGEDGKTHQYTIEDIIGTLENQTVILNEETIHIAPKLTLNGIDRTPFEHINDGDSLEWKSNLTVEDVLKKYVSPNIFNKNKPFEITLNGKSLLVEKKMISLQLNGHDVSMSDIVHDDDRINFTLTDSISALELLNRFDLRSNSKVTVYYNEQPIDLTSNELTIIRNNQVIDEGSFIYPDDLVEIKEQQTEQFIFQDLFRFVEIDLSELKGKGFKLYRNNEQVGFSEPIFDGDQLYIEWVESFTHNE